MSKQTALKHVNGAEREYLEKLIETLELWSETHRAEGRLVSAAELMQASRYLRRLLPTPRQNRPLYLVKSRLRRSGYAPPRAPKSWSCAWVAAPA
jgi:hypothetical protein